MSNHWIDDLRDSLIRGGPHIARHIPVQTREVKDGTSIGFRLQQTLPEDATAAVSKYIKLFARDAGWNVKVRLKKFWIEFVVTGPYVDRASQRSSRRRSRGR